MEPMGILFLLSILGIIAGLYLMVGPSKNKDSGKVLAGISALVFIVSFLYGGASALSAGMGAEFTGIPTSTVPTTTTATCPESGKTSTTVTIRNVLNLSATEKLTPTILATSRDSGYVTTLTSGTASDLPCAETYDVKAISSTTYNARMRGTLAPVPPAATVNDGNLVITPTGSNYAASVIAAKSSAPQVRVFDKDAAAFAFIDATTRGTFTGTGGYVNKSNATATSQFATGTGESISLRWDVRATSEYTDYNDFGTYIIIDAATDKWDIPTVKLNGQVLANIKGQMNADEQRALSAYEYVYKIPQGVPIENVNYASFTTDFAALGGVDPGASDDITVGVTTIGQYQRTTNSNTVGVGAYKDDSSATVAVSTNVWYVDVT